MCVLCWNSAWIQGYPRLQKFTKPKVIKGYQRLTKVTQSYQQLPKVGKGWQRFPKVPRHYMTLHTVQFHVTVNISLHWLVDYHITWLHYLHTDAAFSIHNIPSLRLLQSLCNHENDVSGWAPLNFWPIHLHYKLTRGHMRSDLPWQSLYMCQGQEWHRLPWRWYNFFIFWKKKYLKTLSSILNQSHFQLSHQVLRERTFLTELHSLPLGRCLIHSGGSRKRVYICRHPAYRQRSRLPMSSRIWYKSILAQG